MHPQPHKILANFFTQATFLSICFPCFLCQNNQEYAICTQPFQCGSLRNISFPFWGGIRPLYCGYPGFELVCREDIPLLSISSLSYRVLEINFSIYSLKVARQDLWNNTCPIVLHKTTLDLDLFRIPPHSNDKNVTLYFNCTNVNPKQHKSLLNQFSCDVNGVITKNVFSTWYAGPGPDFTCSKNISVPINQTAAQALETPTASSLNVLLESLATGFFIQWSVDNHNCRRCGHLGGVCVYNRTSGSTVCYNKSQGRTPSLPYREPPGTYDEVWLTLGLVPIIIAYVIIIMCYYNEFRSRDSPDPVIDHDVVSNQDIEKFLFQHGYLALKRYKYSEIVKITKSFNEKLGQGGYGSVYKGTLSDGSLVAVKVLIETDSNGEEFINEVASISRTSHVNIISLLGFCYAGKKRALVYEFMPNKSLDKFIINSGLANEGCHLDLYKLYNIAVGVAKGLDYLHTGCNTRIVHFDIKPQNILLNEAFDPKISDFGLAKLCKKKQSVLSVLGTRGTIGYIAPEVFSTNYGRVSHKSDVYSYGMMILEMAGAKKFLETEVAQSSENYFPDKIYDLVTLDIPRNLDFIVEEEQDLMRKMFLVGFWCIQTSPMDRPLMSKVVEMLEGSLQSIQIPPKPVLDYTLPVLESSPLLSFYTETESSTEAILL